MNAPPEMCAAMDATFRRIYCGNDRLDVPPDLLAAWQASQGETEITLQPAITQGTGTTPSTGLDPVAPGGPGQDRAWGAELLAWIFGEDDPLPMNDPKKPGCCPDGQPRCLKCWLRENVRWLLLIGLVAAVVWFKRKP